MAQRLAPMAPNAREWFLDKIACIAERSPAVARKIIACMREARSLLAEFPNSARQDLIPGTRTFVVEGYLLTLRQKNGIVEIVGLRHSRQLDAFEPSETMNQEADDDENDGGSSPPISPR